MMMMPFWYWVNSRRAYDTSDSDPSADRYICDFPIRVIRLCRKELEQAPACFAVAQS